MRYNQEPHCLKCGGPLTKTQDYGSYETSCLSCSGKLDKSIYNKCCRNTCTNQKDQVGQRIIQCVVCLNYLELTNNYVWRAYVRDIL